ncbi:DUF2268 domain-containing putative Zn-dependent protease [Flavobacterium sp.]|uniref:gliding motility protein GldB-related protein n=1 Tax=Flavobacterium sp. TaxID=239 RepID=UPI0024876A63|nr:DUF2268 domain-containing putative Zn-dependent protease [Flavobacterium sp.]MDI1318047.1 DUF2268 domain-containing putative Zn-dependent protease [Flavobacterium sp.]
MNKQFLILALSFTINSCLFSQTKNSIVSTIDVTNFWVAYDSVQKTTDRTKQLKFIQELYLDKASEGLQDFMIAREHSAKRHLDNILKYPKFWISIRPHTIEIETHKKEINKLMSRFKKLYPSFKQPDVYFMIGCLNSGGTTTKDKILIGSEIACANKNVEASEVSAWLREVFAHRITIVTMVAHEVGHTQQVNGDSENDGKSNLLGYCIGEGSCDFIAELLVKKPIKSPYMIYGSAHEKELWKLFEVEMFGQETENWLYSGDEAPNGNADLGYFMGYKICKSYYENAKDKKKALKEIIELEYTPESVANFLVQSKYPEKWNK